MKKVICLLLSTLLMAGKAQAVDGKNRYLILGPGASYCSDIIANLKEGKERKNQAAIIVYSNWLAGNLTAYNRDTRTTYSILGDMTFTQALEWTFTYCQQHPTQIYSAAVDAFTHEYFDDRYKAFPAGGPRLAPKAKDSDDSDDDSDDK